ncbi:MAG: hypothetical protein CMH57_02885 [Myxococcales bacterium]|nr:hypothetical protein [Myxococcales bacterium]
MGYCMRYITTSSPAPTLGELRDALVSIDARYRLDVTSEAPPSAGVHFDDVALGELAIHVAGDAAFAEEVGELLGGLKGAVGDDPASVRAVLEGASAIIALRVIFGDRDPDETLDTLDPIWGWFMETHEGLIQADDEGYYDDSGLILEVD